MILQAAQDLLAQITLFSTNARDFFVADVYGRGTQNTWGQASIRSIYDGPAQLRAQNPPLNVAFNNTTTIWDGVLGPIQGIKRFGTRARRLAACIVGNGTSKGGSCDDPKHYFYCTPPRAIQVIDVAPRRASRSTHALTDPARLAGNVWTFTIR